MKSSRKVMGYLEERYSLVSVEREPLYWKCVYCGKPADTRDHFPPITRVYDYEALRLEHEFYIKVPACKDCNSMASDILDETFLRRVERVKDKLAKKYRKYLKPLDWDDEELAELGPNLKSKVLENSTKRDVYTAMIEYYGGVDLVLDYLEVGHA